MAYIRENKQKIQELLADIGQATFSMAPKDWTRAVVGYFLEGENEIPHQQIHIFSRAEDDYVDMMEKSWECDDYDDVILDLGIMCRKLHELCAEAGDGWQMMTFQLSRNGRFNVDYSYDPIEDYDARFILGWQGRYLK